MALPRRFACALATGSAVGLLPLVALAILPGHASTRPTARASSAAPNRAVAASMAQVPLAFEPKDHGYLARGDGYALWLDGRRSLIRLDRGPSRAPALLTIDLLGARPVPATPAAKLPGVVNEYRGARSNWRVGVPTFASVRYRSVYDGIDAVYHGRGSALEYDFRVAAGADPARIALSIRGARAIDVARNGDLVLRLPGGTVREARPIAYQTMGQRRVRVAAAFRLGHGRIRFALGRYDRSRPLVIDPVLSYATYLGGNHEDKAMAIGVASDGSFVLTGVSNSDDFPSHSRDTQRSDDDVFATRISKAGDPSCPSAAPCILYTDFIGGTTHSTGWISPNEQANDVLVDSNGGASLVGFTQSTDYPHTAYWDTYNPGDLIGLCDAGGRSAFLTRLGATGTLGYSSCFGGDGDDVAYSLSTRFVSGAARAQQIEIVGQTKSSAAWGVPTYTGFNTTPNSSGDAFIVEIQFAFTSTCDLSPGIYCESMRYRAFLGGISTAYGVASDGTNVYYAGDTTSNSLGGISGNNGGSDAFAGKLTPSSSAPGLNSAWLRYYGTSGTEHGRAVAVAGTNVYVVGDTDSGSLPSADVTGNLVRGSGQDGYIAKFAASDGSLASSTYVGGAGTDSLNDIAVQQNGGKTAEYVVGTTDSGLTGQNQVSGHSCAAANTQALVVKRVDGASPPGQIVTCLGGSNADNGTGIAVSSTATDGTMWVTGYTAGGFPGAAGVQSGFGGGGTDAFAAKLVQAPPTITSSPPDVLGNAPAHFTFTTTESDMQFSCSVPDGTNHLVAGSRSASACPNPGAADYTGLAEGSHTFEVTTLDALGSESAVASHTFSVDLTPPAAFDVSSPADGATVGNLPNFTWSASSDPHGVSYAVVDADTGNPIATTTPACSGGSCSAQPTSPLAPGAYKWKVIASDGASPANTTASTSTRSFTVLDPVQARFTIAPNPALTGKTVTFDGSASADATHTITKYEWDLDGDGSFETSSSSATTTHSYSKAGTYDVALRVTDSNGQTATSTQALKISDLTSSSGAPIGVSIDKGALYTNDPHVTLSVVAPATATSMLVANDGGFMDAKTFLPSGKAASAAVAGPVEIPWTLDSAGSERLPKTVYVRFLIGTFGSPNYTDDIILDTRPPVVQQASVGPAAGAASAAHAARVPKWTVRVKAKDDNSGVRSLQVTANKRKPGKPIAYRKGKSFKVKSAKRPAFVRARDKAGNFSRWKKIR